jgi:hypothetical protein
MNKKHAIKSLVLAVAIGAASPVLSHAQAAPAAAAAAKPLGILAHPELEKLIPPSVYFQGQSATVQIRNAGGIRFPGGGVMFAVKVDTGGYSTSIQERYQDYLVTEIPLTLGAGAGMKTLSPGAYGIGFVGENLLVMDIGGHTLLNIPTQTDAEMARPAPLKIIGHDKYFRLYSGRTYVPFSPQF